LMRSQGGGKKKPSTVARATAPWQPAPRCRKGLGAAQRHGAERTKRALCLTSNGAAPPPGWPPRSPDSTALRFGGLAGASNQGQRSARGSAGADTGWNPPNPAEGGVRVLSAAGKRSGKLGRPSPNRATTPCQGPSASGLIALSPGGRLPWPVRRLASGGFSGKISGSACSSGRQQPRARAMANGAVEESACQGRRVIGAGRA